MDSETVDDDRAVDAPRHGFQGDRATPPAPAAAPAGLTVAVSREAGARGGAVGRRVGRKLGWAVYDQELLEYMAQEGVVRQGVAEGLAPAAEAWAEARLQQLLREQELSQHPHIVNLARVVLALGAQGGVVLIGRGAGCILPRATTLSVRMVAPRTERVAYLAQLLRLSEDEAAERVRLRDERRAIFLSTHFHCQADDPHRYDLVLNSASLGEDACTDLIVRAARFRAAALAPERTASGF